MEADLTKFSCLLKDCKLKFDDLFIYARHLVSYHGLPINIMYLKFKSRTDFKNWRTSEEITNNCMFQNTQSKRLFQCHRSGFIMNSVNEDNLIHNQDEDERHYKIKAPCPAHMKFEEKNDEIHVMYVRTHYGYCAELRKHAISAKTIEIVKEFAQGGKIPEKKIVDNVRSVLKDKNSTDHLITIKHVISILKARRDD